jgi:DNA-binding XRE family transcriptional regulator
MTTRSREAQRPIRAALREELYDRVRAGDVGLIEAVRMMRKVAGKSQADYAKLVGVSPRSLIDFERGIGNPTIGTLQKILAPFGFELTVRVRTRDGD